MLGHTENKGLAGHQVQVPQDLCAGMEFEKVRRPPLQISQLYYRIFGKAHPEPTTQVQTYGEALRVGYKIKF